MEGGGWVGLGGFISNLNSVCDFVAVGYDGVSCSIRTGLVVPVAQPIPLVFFNSPAKLCISGKEKFWKIVENRQNCCLCFTLNIMTHSTGSIKFCCLAKVGYIYSTHCNTPFLKCILKN